MYKNKVKMQKDNEPVVWAALKRRSPVVSAVSLLPPYMRVSTSSSISGKTWK
jgi:hypothetical protein